MSKLAASRPAATLLTTLVVLAAAPSSAAEHSFEFVAEHLPEVAMDNRFATLPLWSSGQTRTGPWQWSVQGAYMQTASGGLTLSGPMLSVAVRRPLNERWSVQAFGFLDDLRFSGGDQRPLETLFAAPPLELPAEALFTDLHGSYRNAGAGIAFARHESEGWLGEHQWTFGVLYQRMKLSDYQAAYRVLDGASSGATGLSDYSAEYTFVSPFAGLAAPRRFGAWTLSPHVLLAVPLPRRGVQGRITGPGFDLSGNTADVGNGKHVGDISVTLGLDATYEPWGLTMDIGSLVTQALLEPVIHKGIDTNWVVSLTKRF